MGQAWCKEKSCKAQDSKSPLDRVFVRCAHTIYPSLKEEGSVLGGGGATQRVASSEIGYSGSPPALLRGTSIDSVDRPFHPSDWVDVNLEVPCEPRASVTRYNSYTTAYNAYQQRDNSAWPLANGSKNPKCADISSLTPMTVGGAPVPPPRRRRRRHHQDRSTSSGVMSTSGEASTTGGACSSGGDRTEDDDDDDVDPNYAKLLFTSSTSAASKKRGAKDDDAARASKRDSDDEFVEIERSLDQAESMSTETRNDQQHQRARPKNQSTTSLPNVAELLIGGESQVATSSSSLPRRTEEAVRPARHVKANSLPRDALMCAPQTPERLCFPTRKIEEDRSTDDEQQRDTATYDKVDDDDDDDDVNTKKDDNSIFKIDDEKDDDVVEAVGTAATAAGEVSLDSSLRFEADVKTSTPVKDYDVDAAATAAAAEVSTSSRNLEDVFLSFADQSTSTNDSSNSSSQQQQQQQEGSSSSLFVAPHEVDRPPSVQAAAAAAGIRNDDAGYESKSGSHLFSDGSTSDPAAVVDAVGNAIGDDYQELSSGILRDAIIDSTEGEEPSLLQQQNQPENPIVLEMQRTLSEESLPREMLIEYINDEEEVNEVTADDEKSAKDTSNRRTRESFKTPPPSPVAGEIKRQGRESASSSTVSIVDVTEEEEKKLAPEATKAMTPSLMELEVALTGVLEKKNEEERERADQRTKDEAEIIVPTKVESNDAGENGVSKSRVIEFNRSARINPFDDYKLEDIVFNNSASLENNDSPPEKPNRLHRISLIEESMIDEPLVVPTPPRRKHRSSRSSGNGNTASINEPVVHTYAINDRLI